MPTVVETLKVITSIKWGTADRGLFYLQIKGTNVFFFSPIFFVQLLFVALFSPMFLDQYLLSHFKLKGQNMVEAIGRLGTRLFGFEYSDHAWNTFCMKRHPGGALRRPGMLLHATAHRCSFDHDQLLMLSLCPLYGGANNGRRALRCGTEGTGICSAWYTK